MSPTAFLVCGRLVLLIATTAQLARGAPAAWFSKEYLSSPDSYQDYLTLREPGQTDEKRAPWAPSMPRSDMFSQRIRELISERNKGKRSKQSEQYIEMGDLSDEDVTALLKYLQTQLQGLDYEEMNFDLKALNEREKSAAQQNDIGKSRSAGKEFRGGKGGPVIYQLDGPDGGFKQQPKRSSSPFNLGLGQHAASAAMSAYENILDESRNYKPERPSSPVRFLGKR